MKRPNSQVRVGDMIRWKGWEIVRKIEQLPGRPDGLCFTTNTGNGCCVDVDGSTETIRRTSVVTVEVYEDGQVIVAGGEEEPDG